MRELNWCDPQNWQEMNFTTLQKTGERRRDSRDAGTHNGQRKGQSGVSGEWLSATVPHRVQKRALFDCLDHDSPRCETAACADLIHFSRGAETSNRW